MPIFDFEAMDATGLEIKDTIDAEHEAEAQQKIRELGYFVTRIKPSNGEFPAATKEDRERNRLLVFSVAMLFVGFALGAIFGYMIGFVVRGLQ